jgi:hypothetical protein
MVFFAVATSNNAATAAEKTDEHRKIMDIVLPSSQIELDNFNRNDQTNTIE